MNALVVVENEKRWPLELANAHVVTARDYLFNPLPAGLRRPAVFNLSRSYSYQSMGYYVSLLAAARGHRPLPSVETLQDLRNPTVFRLLSEDLDELVQKSLGPLRSDTFELSIYFGHNLAKRYDPLSRALFNQFPAPLLRATFDLGSKWRLTSIRAIGTRDIPDAHRDFAVAQAEAYFARPTRAPKAKREARYELAILWSGESDASPSDGKAVRKFVRAAASLGLNATIITLEDYGRIAEFDALLIRDTTAVNHYTYRFARRAAVEGLVVMDDPVSIVRCTNKIFQAEAFARHGVPQPQTAVVHSSIVDELAKTRQYPCVLKVPDSAFSQGVVKVENAEAFVAECRRLLQKSDLVIAQEFVPSEFDWRVGICDRRPLYVCRYHMARGHWQIVRKDSKGKSRYGKVETLALDDAPSSVVDIALRAANVIGDGLYGVDLKEVKGRLLVTEVNDNPNIDAGYEDKFLKDELYLSIMRVFRERLDARGASSAS